MSKAYTTHLEKIEAYIASKPLDWQAILYEVDALVGHAHPEMCRWFKYGVPFYGIKKNICYVNLRANHRVLDVGFVQGAVLEKKHALAKELFAGRELKSVRHLRITPESWSEKKMIQLNDLLMLAIDDDLLR